MTRKHASIEQLDGSDSVTDDLEILDRKYTDTEHYWAEGRIGRVYQAFLHANDIIENNDLKAKRLKSLNFWKQESVHLVRAINTSLLGFEVFHPFHIFRVVFHQHIVIHT